MFFSLTKNSKFLAIIYLASEKIYRYDPKGILIPAPSNGLVDICENLLGVDFATVDFAFLVVEIAKIND